MSRQFSHFSSGFFWIQPGLMKHGANVFSAVTWNVHLLVSDQACYSLVAISARDIGFLVIENESFFSDNLLHNAVASKIPIT